jgi:hypothetical protein
MRGQITPTGITWINRLEKTYQEKDYASLSQTLLLRCNYALLESILLNEWDGIVADSASANLAITIGGDCERCSSCVLDEKKGLRKVVQLADKQQQLSYRILYTYPKTRSKKNKIPASLVLSWEGMHLQLNYEKTRCVSNVLVFPFKIPSRYDNLSTN